MTKTQKVYEKRPRDFYPTPYKAVIPLLEHLPEAFTFCEPCAGAGDLVRHLERLFEGCTCFLPIDIEPQVDWVTKADANSLTSEAVEYCNYIITNPPFTNSILSPLMDKWIALRPTVLLLPADFAHNIRFSRYLDVCEKIVSVGRVRWFEETKMSSTENFAWYFFNKDKTEQTKFYGRNK